MVHKKDNPTSSLFNLQKSFFHSRKDPTLSFRLSLTIFVTFEETMSEYMNQMKITDRNLIFQL